MTYCYVTNGDYEPNYVITINTNTHEVIDSVGYDNQPFRDLRFIDNGHKALITDYQSVYIEDVLTHDIIALLNRNIGSMGRLIVSSNEEYLTHLGEGFGIYTLPDLNIVDSVRNSSLLPIGIDGGNKILYAFKRDTSLVYSIDFSVTPSETTIIEILYWRPNPERTVSGFLSPDNSTIFINCIEGIDDYLFLEYDADSLNCRNIIEGQYFAGLVWTSDGVICYGINNGSIVKYNTLTKIYGVVIDKDKVFSPNYNWEFGVGFYAVDIQLTADNKYLYIQLPPDCGGPCLGLGGHTLVYDLDSHDFVYRYDYSDYLLNGAGLMRLNPKDWSK